MEVMSSKQQVRSNWRRVHRTSCGQQTAGWTKPTSRGTGCGWCNEIPHVVRTRLYGFCASLSTFYTWCAGSLEANAGLSIRSNEIARSQRNSNCYIPMFFGSSNPIRILAMSYDQTGVGTGIRKLKMAASNFKYRPLYISACTLHKIATKFQRLYLYVFGVSQLTRLE